MTLTQIRGEFGYDITFSQDDKIVIFWSCSRQGLYGILVLSEKPSFYQKLGFCAPHDYPIFLISILEETIL